MKAKYTVLLKTLMENEETMKLIDKALEHYPLYGDIPHFETLKHPFLTPPRNWLNEKLLNHYKYREIAFETIGRFIDELEITMEEIMPYYNQRFKTIVIMSELPNPFDNVDVTEEYTEERSGTATSSSQTDTNDEGNSQTTAQNKTNTRATVEHNNKSVHTTTPSDTISIPSENINSVSHADDVSWNKDSNSDVGTSEGESSSTTNNTNNGHSTSTANGENKSTIHHTFTKKGNQGVNTYAHDMNEYRTTIIDVVNEIITDPRVSDLFMKVY